MTFEEIKTLLDAGFTPEMIMQLTNTTQGTPPAENPRPDILPGSSAGSPSPADHTAPAGPDSTDEGPALPQEETPPTQETILEEMQTEINNLKAQLQRENIISKSVDILPGGIRENAESVLAEIIRPKYNTNNAGGNNT